ncbi:hypothetical protein SISNIDRAFT_511080 [Sistotremastrum niveocremeum HHB9708]|uniref:Uncharacterized protein n=2 Tax=Sistotremastraceae TaxID=3402574 RepID=A0A164TPK3_9AGAM|nr:hypothetical protein SISNIDRAFT_511080 [Sistotremastrum niveocremeum HHB9708]KZT42203.1 hypothetical protein SISSUDRAFT_1077174 [Sistotremastrum suecicum HHB10207 ss-3]
MSELAPPASSHNGRGVNGGTTSLLIEGAFFRELLGQPSEHRFTVSQILLVLHLDTFVAATDPTGSISDVDPNLTQSVLSGIKASLKDQSLPPFLLAMIREFLMSRVKILSPRSGSSQQDCEFVLALVVVAEAVGGCEGILDHAASSRASPNKSTDCLCASLYLWHLYNNNIIIIIMYICGGSIRVSLTMQYYVQHHLFSSVYSSIT